MKYSIEAIRQANMVIDKRNADALEAFAANKAMIYDKIPRLAEIDSQLATSGAILSSKIANRDSNIQEVISDIRERNRILIEQKRTLLKENGFDENLLNVPYTCKKCNDSGYVDAMPCDCLKEILADIAKNDAVKKSEQNNSSFENFNLDYYPDDLNGIPCKKLMGQILESCKGYAENFSTQSQSLLIFGTTGIGKTHISRAITKVVCEKGYSVIYVSAPDLFTALENERFNNEKPEYSMRDLTACDLLVLDDLGAEFTTSFTISALYNIVNTRLNMGIPTIITANLIPSELTARYSDRIASRIIGCYEHLRFSGSDIRLLKKRK